MWSDEPSAAATRRRVESVDALLPRRARDAARPLVVASGAEAERIASGLRSQPGFVWLDGGSSGRHLMAWRPVLALRSSDGASTLTCGRHRRRWRCGGMDALTAVEEALAARAARARLFGFLGYELGAELESLPAPPARDMPLPDLALGLHDLWLEGDGGRWRIVGPGTWEGAPGARRRRAEVESALTARPTAVALRSPGKPRSVPSPAGYRAAVARTVRRIFDGELFETNLCRRLEAPLPAASAWPLYVAMRRTGEAEYAAYLDVGGARVLSRSPEAFLRVRGSRVESRPIKGTRPRHADPERDRLAREDLRTADKDAAELAMIVDLVRNDLGRVCRAGSVEVAAHAGILELATVWHTVSRIRGRLRAGVTATRLLRASFPPGSITGAPKIHAMTVSRIEEPRRRGVAMGSVGWIEPGGDLELSVAIRTAVVGGGRVVYHAGCGIVADSDPASELAETVAKCRVFEEALRGDGRLLQR